MTAGTDSRGGEWRRLRPLRIEHRLFEDLLVVGSGLGPRGGRVPAMRVGAVSNGSLRQCWRHIYRSAMPRMPPAK